MVLSLPDAIPVAFYMPCSVHCFAQTGKNCWLDHPGTRKGVRGSAVPVAGSLTCRVKSDPERLIVLSGQAVRHNLSITEGETIL
jgi:hypothetical protein